MSQLDPIFPMSLISKMTSTNGIAGALRVYGNLSVLEMAPVLLAAGGIYPGKTILEHGGVMSLWGKASDLPSLTATARRTRVRSFVIVR